MLTRRALAELSRAHENQLVLSVYIGRDGVDPGARGAWRLHLQRSLEAIRSELAGGSSDRAPFDRAAVFVEQAVRDFGRVLPHQGWAGFATADGLFHAEGLPFAPRDLVRWRQGIYAAPYVRALKSARPVVLALREAEGVAARLRFRRA